MFHIEHPSNEPIKSFQPGSLEKTELKAALQRIASERREIPCWIGGQEVRTSKKLPVVMPHDHRHVLGDYFSAGPSEMEQAIEAARRAKPEWESLSWQSRAAIFLKAADLIAGPHRARMNAATMLGQSKNAFQAEIDSACELIDFLRFNAYFYQEILKVQPDSPNGVWNQTEYRSLEGFVLAITPFNFTAIAANLPCAPALLGNTVLWKPSHSQMLAAQVTLEVLKEAGLPAGVINLIPAEGAVAGKYLLPHPDLAGVHFTGSTATFQNIWGTVGENIRRYRTYPRLVGETGGKDFVFVHPSADVEAVAVALVRGAFEYQGQKCSAASRAYVPKSLWKQIQERVFEDMASFSMGDVRDFRNFINAVIDEKAFKRISSYIHHAQESSEAKVLYGGKCQSERGYFIEPTVIQAESPRYQSMVEEIFGPVLTVFVYEDKKLEEALELCDESTPYALTGAIFAQDRYAIEQLSKRLVNAAGNFYINDKPTGAVVGQQPFGGARASGTNDKAGSALNLYRWLSPRSIKETRVPVKDYRYPFMSAE